MSRQPPLTYAEAGVSLEAADVVVDRLRHAVDSTRTSRVLGGLGGFAGLLSAGGFRHPVLASGTDTVGSKLLLQLETGRLDETGIDLVAMSVNDVITCGAAPMLFLDCISIGRLDPERVATIVEGIAQGCRQAGCALVGGETAEMGDLYSRDGLDIAGFAVGIVERDEIVNGSRVAAGDAIIGIASSGAHSNGFTLVRRLLERAGARAVDAPPGLLEPTRIYAGTVRALLERCDVRAMSHVTGGGIEGNLARVLPDGLGAEVDLAAWPRPEVFDWLAGLGVDESEMRRVFNLGLGYLAVVPRDDAATALETIAGAGESAFEVGRITAQPGVALRA